MGWRPQTGLLLTVLLLASSSTIAQDGLEQTTQFSVPESDGTPSPVDVRNEEESSTQDPSDEIISITSQPTNDEETVIENFDSEIAEEKDKSGRSSLVEVQTNEPSAVEEKSGVSGGDAEGSASVAQTTPSEFVPEEMVEDQISDDEASKIENASPDIVSETPTQIKQSEIAEPTTTSQLLVETENEGQQDMKLLLSGEDNLQNSGSVNEPEENVASEPGSVGPEKVDYTSWRVYKVDGVASPPSTSLRDELAGDDNSNQEGFDALMQLEENPHVRVLHENQLQNFFQIAISPDAARRAEVLSDLESRGFTLQDTQVDLGQLIAEAEDGVFRSGLPKGAVTFDSYMTYEQIEDFITEFAKLHPQVVTKSEIGRSVEGRPIHMLTLTLGAGSAQTLTRQSRQAPRTPEQSYPAIDATLKALERIITWSDNHDNQDNQENQDYKDNQDYQENQDYNQGQGEAVSETEKIETQDQKRQQLFERAQGLRRENGPPPGFLEHMIYNMPYEVINEDEPFSGVVSDTYSTLNKIINNTQVEDDDYPLVDFADESPEVQVAYKVLQRIMNYDQKEEARKFFTNPEEVENIDVSSNRIAKSLDTEKTTSENEAKPGAIDIDEEAEILFIVTSIIPDEYADNKTMIDSIADSVRIIMKNVPRGLALTDEVVQRIAPQIVQIPGVVGIASDSTSSKSQLVSKLDKILRSRNALLTTNKSDQFLSGQDGEGTGPTLRASSSKPVIFIDGGIHAREWISPAFLLYAATQLVDSTELLLGAEWQLVPVLNPDGYVHTWTGDRMWRKNRAEGSLWCRGVDLNRNFGYKHGGKGSSGNHCSEIYRGPKAFSEPESRAVKAAVEAVKDRLQAYVTVHSYGQMILHPWGYDSDTHPDEQKMASMGDGMSDAMRAVNGEEYVVGSAAAVLYPAAGGSDDWASSLGVPYSFTLELRDTGSRGFILPASQILPTVKETWEGIKYLGQRVIRETPQLRPATAPTALSQDGLDMLSALQGVGITATNAEELMKAYPSLVPVDQEAVNRFRSGIPDVFENPSSSPYAPLVPLFGLGPTKLDFGSGQRASLSQVFPPNAHFKQPSNVGLPRNDFVSQMQHGVVLLESSPSPRISGPALLSHFAEPALQTIGFQNQQQHSQSDAHQRQTQDQNKFRDSLQEHELAVNPSFSSYPFHQQNFPQYNIPYPALLPVPQFLPGIQAESQFGGSSVPYNSPMLIKPSFFDPEIQSDQTSFRYEPSSGGSQVFQTSKFSNDGAQSQPFNPSLRISDQPFRPILQPLPISPAQAHFKTNIHAVTAPEVPEAEPKFAHPFLDSPNILVSLGSPQHVDPNAFRYEVPQNGHYSIIKYPRAIRRRGLPIQQ